MITIVDYGVGNSRAFLNMYKRLNTPAETATEADALRNASKVISGAGENPDLVAGIAKEIGSQSVVVVLDVRKARNVEYEVWTHNAMRRAARPAPEAIRDAESRGAGEIVVNSIDRDGQMKGYDLDLAAMVRATTRLPMTILGGAGTLADIGAPIGRCGVIGAAAGSVFVFKGPYRAVLISYPSQAQKEELIRAATGN